jgi:hypothetical protein
LPEQGIGRIFRTHPVDEGPWYSERESAQGGGACSPGAVSEVEQFHQLNDIGHDIGKVLPPRTGRPGSIAIRRHPAQSRSFGMISASKEIRRWRPTT